MLYNYESLVLWMKVGYENYMYMSLSMGSLIQH